MLGFFVTFFLFINILLLTSILGHGVKAIASGKAQDA